VSNKGEKIRLNLKAGEKAGEKKTITFTFPVEKLAFYNIDMKKVVEPGRLPAPGRHKQPGGPFRRI
jgi:hypothetical protein